MGESSALVRLTQIFVDYFLNLQDTEFWSDYEQTLIDKRTGGE
jgi:hypothetical protein